MKKLILFFCLSIIIILNSCTNITEPEEIEQFIPTSEATGPGGPAYLYGFIKDFVHPLKAASKTHVYIVNQQNYSDTISHVFVNSTDASFKIIEMPEGVFDIIFINDKYLSAKLSKLTLKPTGNSFYNPNSGGYFIDSTIYITNIADSVGRPDAPEFGLQGYGPAITVYLKAETADSIGWQIVQNSGCDTLRVYRYNDPVFDPFENDVYYLRCNNIEEVKVKLIYFNYKETILLASPVYKVIEN